MIDVCYVDQAACFVGYITETTTSVFCS